MMRFDGSAWAWSLNVYCYSCYPASHNHWDNMLHWYMGMKMSNLGSTTLSNFPFWALGRTAFSLIARTQCSTSRQVPKKSWHLKPSALRASSAAEAGIMTWAETKVPEMNRRHADERNNSCDARVIATNNSLLSSSIASTSCNAFRQVDCAGGWIDIDGQVMASHRDAMCLTASGLQWMKYLHASFMW